ncbi:MAG TPA: MFS transporter [Trebonia sp.]|nr:MFS transporter [Trebonia sp.]
MTRRGVLLAGMALAVLLEAVDQTIVSTALPKMAGSLHGFASYQWVVSAYLLAAVAVVTAMGRLSDRIGRRAVMIPGVVVFLAGSVLASLAPSMGVLIAGRAVQGLGAGIGLALVNAVLADLFPPAQRAKWQGLFVAAYGVASVAGPGLGGWLSAHGPVVSGWVSGADRWRWIFLVNLPLGALALIAITVGFAAAYPSPATGGSKRVDVPGSLLAAVAAVAFVAGCTAVGQPGPWWHVAAPLAAAAVAAGGFAWWELRAADPIVDLGLLADRTFRVCCELSLLLGVALLSMVLYLPLLIQVVIGLSPGASGLALTPLSVAFVVGSAIGGATTAKLGVYRPQARTGALLAIAGVAILLLAGTRPPLAMIIAGGAVTNVGIGMLLPIVMVVVQTAVPASDIGSATAVLTQLRQLGQVVGTAVSTGIVITVANQAVHGSVAAGLDRLLAGRPAGNVQAAARASGIADAVARGVHAGLIATLVAAVALALVTIRLPAGAPLRPEEPRPAEEQATEGIPVMLAPVEDEGQTV